MPAETVRFAPSPTGEIHIGNVRPALYNWFLASQSGGTFVLRYDDTDTGRSRDEYAKQIAADLAWLGIVPDRVEYQSKRIATYDAAADKLREAGLLYACYETPEELDRKRALQRARGKPPVYDRAGLNLSAAEKAAFEAEGRRPHWRFKLPEGERSWTDLVRGPVTVPLDTVSDPILIREDGSYLYTLPSVVDDIDFGITVVARGEDHVTNSGVQIAIFEALGGVAPKFAHHNLLIRADGEPLSKRDNPLSIRALTEAGYEPMAVACLAVLTGTSHAVQPFSDLASLGASVSIGDVSRGPATFDPAELGRLNTAIVHALPFEKVEDLLASADAADADFWRVVRGNLNFRKDAIEWAHRWHADPRPELTADAAAMLPDAAFVAAAIEALPAEPWSESTAKAWADGVKERTGAKGKALFMPLRIAMTGATHGPELGPWLLLLGRDKALQRLTALQS